MQLEAIPTHSVRIKDILTDSLRLKNVETYCEMVDSPEKEKTLFRRKFNNDEYRELKLDANVIKKHLQIIENSGAGWLKYDKTHGFFLIEYI